jgi:lipoate-protein ligase A
MGTERASWRLIIDGDLPGAHNMARDVAILEAVSEGDSQPTLRLYGWDPPCLTLGRHQGPDAADFDFCLAEGIDIVRRPTGGRALLHDLELTYAVAAPLGTGTLPRGLQEAYRLICGALVQAMRTLGVRAELTGGDVNLQLPGPRSTIPCFESPAGGEVVVRGRKLIGSAMRAHSGSILQHGAIVLDWDGGLQAGSMGLSDDSTLRANVTTVAAELGRTATRSEIEPVVVQAFADQFSIDLTVSGVSSPEAEREDQLAAGNILQTSTELRP